MFKHFNDIEAAVSYLREKSPQTDPDYQHNMRTIIKHIHKLLNALPDYPFACAFEFIIVPTICARYGKKDVLNFIKDETLWR